MPPPCAGEPHVSHLLNDPRSFRDAPALRGGTSRSLSTERPALFPRCPRLARGSFTLAVERTTCRCPRFPRESLMLVVCRANVFLELWCGQHTKAPDISRTLPNPAHPPLDQELWQFFTEHLCGAIHQRKHHIGQSNTRMS